MEHSSTVRNLIICSALLIVSISSYAFQKPANEDAKINKLISSIEHLSDAKFWRNGSLYSPSEAANHLRSKRNKAGSSIKTAEDFIIKIASSSSFSGKPYKIIYNDGSEMLVRDFLNLQLKGL